MSEGQFVRVATEMSGRHFADPTLFPYLVYRLIVASLGCVLEFVRLAHVAVVALLGPTPELPGWEAFFDNLN